MNKPLALLVVAALVACACKKPDVSYSSADATPAADAAPSAPSASPPRDGGAALEGRVEPNLLQLVPAKVAVSSSVENPHDFPEHLMDGRADSAWNSRTGDLVGGWIAFRIPKDARVDAIKLTVGFDKKTDKIDLFTANHRVKRVRISKDGRPIKEASLDVDRRALQSISIGDSGGEYRVEILETVAGTKKEWKELTISELLVVGKPGKELRAAGQPLRITVGSLDGTIPRIPPERLESAIQEPQKDLVALCGVYVQWAGAQYAKYKQHAAEGPGSERRDEWKDPFCKEASFTGTFKGDGTWRSVRAVRLGFGLTDELRLVAELARGFVLTEIAWGDTGANIMGCPSVFVPTSLPEVRVESGMLLALVEGERIGAAEGPTGEPNDDGLVTVLERGATYCKDSGKTVTCEFYNPQYQEALAIKRQPKRNTRTPWSTLPWKDVKKFHLEPSGALTVD